MSLFYLQDCKTIQSNLNQIANRTFEIERAISLNADPKDQIDAAVRFVQTTKTLLDKFKTYASDPARSSQFQTYSLQLQNACAHLERSVEQYRPGIRKDKLVCKNPFTPGSSVSSLADVEVAQTGSAFQSSALQDLRRVEKEMNSLQQIYQQLKAQALDQQGSIELISHGMGRAQENTENANKELLITREGEDRKLKWKIYVISFLAFFVFLSFYLSR
jgi:hypothetical protein